jgi:hypothetical protein
VIEVPERPGWRDYFQMITTGFMIVLGSYILWQTIFVRWAIPSLIFSVALLLFSVFRIKMIWTYFQQKGRRDGI